MRKQKPSAEIPIEDKEVQEISSQQKDVRKGWLRRSTPRTSHAAQPPNIPHRHTKGLSTSLRAGLAVIGGRAAGALSRRLHLGGGTSIAGIVAQRLYPDIVSHLAAQLAYGSVIVTGTNGKTTTSSFIAAILSDAGLRVWRNREGSNLMQGIAGALLIRAHPNGRLRRTGKAIAVFETDEAVVPQLAKAVPPRVAVFTNLFRDQLDRYGEVDTVAARWQQAVSTLPTDTILVLNADDPTTANLGEAFTGQVHYFGIDDPSLDLTSQNGSSERHQVIDSRTCPRCGNDYTYTLRFYSHMGHYSCPNCGYTRPQPHVRAVKVLTDDFDRLRMLVETPTQQGEIIIPLPGLYNVYNALAAITAAFALQINWKPIVTGIEQFKPVFGRGERIQVDGRTIRLLLAKNPTGFNEVLRTLFSDGTPRHVLFILNDNTADGRDISWIWDVDFERILHQTGTLVVAGTRALDLALRLKYAGISKGDMMIVPPTPLHAARRGVLFNIRSKSRRSRKRNVNVGALSPYPFGNDASALSAPSRRGLASGSSERKEVFIAPHEPGHYGIAAALDTAITQTPTGETLFIIPTYTGLLEVHSELEKRGLTPHYWEEHNS